MKLAAVGEPQESFLFSLLASPSPNVRSAAAFALAKSLGDRATDPLSQALMDESDPGTLQAFVQALASLAALPRESDAARRIRGERVLEALYVDRLIMARFEDILHFGGMPGFYDGQFAGLFGAYPGMEDRLGPITRDPDYTYLIRALAVMALHECRDPAVLAVLLPLIMDPREELRLEWEEVKRLEISEEMILSNRMRNLSKYARFSLAKAGYPEFNLAKIEALKDWLQRNSDQVFKRSFLFGLDAAGIYDPYREFGKNCMLEIGYNYQQFDQYEEAERWYRSLLERFQPDKEVRYMAEAHYNLACLYAVTSRTDRAIEELSLAIDKGFMDVSWMDRDRDLDSIRNTPEYHGLKDRILHAETVPENPE